VMWLFLAKKKTQPNISSQGILLFVFSLKFIFAKKECPKMRHELVISRDSRWNTVYQSKPLSSWMEMRRSYVIERPTNPHFALMVAFFLETSGLLRYISIKALLSNVPYLTREQQSPGSIVCHQSTIQHTGNR
jgi:hypothetical protein